MSTESSFGDESELLQRQTRRIIAILSQLGKWMMPPYGDPPAKGFVEAVQREIKSEAVSLFIRSPTDPTRLFFKAGIGYRDGFETVEYKLGEADKRPTAYVC